MKPQDPYTPPAASLEPQRLYSQMEFPLGKLTVPWILLLALGAGWSLGSMATYALSLYFRGFWGATRLPGPLPSLPLVGDWDDLAGLICYTLSFALSGLLATGQARRNWPSWRLAPPPARICGRSFVSATLLLAPVWAGAAGIFERWRTRLPGDGNWPAIACFTGIGVIHWMLIRNQVRRHRAAAGTETVS
jgi:hypothetical protein